MRKKTTVIVNGKRKTDIRTKLIVVTVLILALLAMLGYTIIKFLANNKFAEDINEIWKLNSNTIFSIDNIYV